MPIFEYRARDKDGEIISGVLNTENEGEVVAYLDSLGYFPVSIKVKAESLLAKIASFDLLAKFERIKHTDLILFNRQLATLVSAGLPFISSLDAVAEQTESKKLKRVIARVRYDVEGGSSFSEALSQHPQIFSELYVNMIRAGEEGGMLDEILNRLAALAEHEAEIRARIKTAVRYPIIVIVTVILAFIVLMTVVVPQFIKLFDKYQGTLPLPTRILIGINYIFQHYWYVILGFTIIAIFLISKYINTEKGRKQLDKLKLKFPVFGILFLKIAMSRFANTFGSLIKSGIPILQTLDIVSKTVGNVIIENTILNVRDSVREGESLAEPMKTSKIFPPMVVQMVAVGEETGTVDEMLAKVADYYDMEVDYAIRNLTTAIEPILILFIGGMILFLALAIFLPWWNMISLF